MLININIFIVSGKKDVSFFYSISTLVGLFYVEVGLIFIILNYVLCYNESSIILNKQIIIL